MTKWFESLWRPWVDEARGLVRDLENLAQAHLELATLEAQQAARLVKRTAAVGVIAGVLLLTGLPLLVWVACDALASVSETSREVWLLSLGGGLVAIGGLAMLLAWLRFRRQWRGLDDTLAELREHAAWWKEQRKC